MSLKPGQHVGQYVIVEQIGKGGMATVFRASQPSLSRQVAIKVLPEFFKEDPTFHDRFRQEAMAIAKLRHPNVLTVFDSGEADGIAYIVTELVEGGTLANKLGKPMPMDDVLAIAGPVASALDYAHARGMIHRDVKPSNILLGHDGTPILSDFGLARLTGGTAEETVTRLTVTGSTLGTPEYMAPEQVRNSAVGPSADIYALAVTLYEMLTGTVPYKADTPINVIMSRLNDPLPLPRSKNPNISEAVQDVLLKGLAMNPDDRYRTAGEMVRALETAARSAVTMAVTPPTMAARFPDASTAPTATAIRVPTPAPATTRPAQTRRGRVLGPIQIAVIIGLSAFLIWRQFSQSAPQNTETSVSATTPPPTPASTTSSPTPPPPAAAAANPPPPAPSPAPPAVPPSTPTTTSANTAPAGKRAPGDGLPPHGKLIYALAMNLSELPSVQQRNPQDKIVLKDGGAQLTATSESGAFVPIPVSGAGDFVAVLRVAQIAQRPTMNFRFHSTPQFEGHVVRFAPYLHLEPPRSGTGDAQHPCCEAFDIFLAPQKPGGVSLIRGSLPLSTLAAPDEEQTYVVSVKGPQIVVYSGGQVIARTIDSTFGPGGMGLSLIGARGQTTSLLLKSFEIFESASAPAAPTTAMPAHGKLLFDMAGHLPELAQFPQQRPDNTITIKNASLEFSVGTEGGALTQLPITGVDDFVAMIKMTAIQNRPLLQLRFRRSNTTPAVQVAAYLRLSAPEPGARPVGDHPCCQDFDVLMTPFVQGALTLFNGPPPRSAPAPSGETQQIAVSVKGPLIVVYADGREIARATTSQLSGGGIGLMALPRNRGQVPSVLRLDTLQIYDVVR